MYKYIILQCYVLNMISALYIHPDIILNENNTNLSSFINKDDKSNSTNLSFDEESSSSSSSSGIILNNVTDISLKNSSIEISNDNNTIQNGKNKSSSEEELLNSEINDLLNEIQQNISLETKNNTIFFNKTSKNNFDIILNSVNEYCSIFSNIFITLLGFCAVIIGLPNMCKNYYLSKKKVFIK
ncbi:hypothetical protein LbFV_ORF6 [Leptopilina boulardi filamentous virus]|uniref:Uncharacterized protein n=1 Tax=Leptopilina boulardi filamentous virus TaxID=552509 RepID=A0A1S5YD47_9VIRU|nr:hypothetical protein LbFV_ORF6 [Leptopilina boulardi filamentous virus]AQQ79926.1 hypothetical protein LbFV_ORF6 [Leptopilina boulardi filamentous virus]